ncbi:type II secretion system protein F [mine drainage metagenome]|uniref:Type II secretion system protein F n=1 Tax=mine drainage metagenome TaxID=410659 RepID=A0A1J5QJC3_9ZZZZ
MATAKAFAYTGRNSAGKLVKGSVDATGEGAVVARLLSMGLSPVSISQASTGTGLRRDIEIPGFKKRIKIKELAVMSRQMATMIGAGLSLLRTLNILAEQTESKPLALILGQVRDEVESGMSTSDAFAKHAEVFPPLMISMVRAGETGGFLEGALESIAVNFEKEVQLKGKIKAALTYPVIVLIMSMISVVSMLVFIVPVFQKMFASLGGKLPLPTLILVELSHAMAWIGPIMTVAIIAFTIWWPKNKNTERVRRRLDPLKLRLPVFGLLLKKIAIARFSRNFSDMIGAGVPILRALQIVGETSGNWVIQESLEKVADSVRQGHSLSGPLADQPVFPPMVTQMIAVGEDAGSLEVMLDKIADFYDQEVEAATEQLTAMIEPLMVAFLGVVIGSMVIALYMPIFNISKLIK